MFLLQHSDQKQLPNHSRSAAGQVQKLREKSSSRSNNTPGIATNLMQSSQGLQMYQGTWQNQSTLQQGPEGLGLLFGGTLPPQAGQYVTSQSSSSHMHSVVITTSASDKNALMVSVPCQSLTSRFRLVSRPVAPQIKILKYIKRGWSLTMHSAPPFTDGEGLWLLLRRG